MSDALTTEERRDYDIALKNGREGSYYEVPVGVVGGLLDTIDRLCAQIEELRGLVNRAYVGDRNPDPEDGLKAQRAREAAEADYDALRNWRKP